MPAFSSLAGSVGETVVPFGVCVVVGGRPGLVVTSGVVVVFAVVVVAAVVVVFAEVVVVVAAVVVTVVVVVFAAGAVVRLLQETATKTGPKGGQAQGDGDRLADVKHMLVLVALNMPWRVAGLAAKGCTACALGARRVGGRRYIPLTQGRGRARLGRPTRPTQQRKAWPGPLWRAAGADRGQRAAESDRWPGAGASSRHRWIRSGQ